MNRVAKVVSVASFFLVVFAFLGSASAAQTYCQENGHGASGCPMTETSTGYCWANKYSPTGYVCKEEQPPAEQAREMRTLDDGAGNVPVGGTPRVIRSVRQLSR